MSFAAQAQIPTRESVSELLHITKTEALLGDAQTMTKALIEQNLNRAVISTSKPLNAAQNQAVKKYQQQINAVLSEVLLWSKLEDQLIQIYSTTFNQKEINDMIAFIKPQLGSLR